MTVYLDKLNALSFVAAWMTDETSGTVAADAIGSLDGEYVSSPTLNQTSLALNREYASIDINGGTSGYLNVADDAAFQPSEFTVAIHGLVENLYDFRCLMNYRSISNNGGWTLDYNADGSMNAYVRVNTGTSAWRSAAAAAGTLVANEAAFWCITYDGDYIRLYKNGSQVAISSQFTGTLDVGTGTRSMRFGAHITSGARIDGRIQGPAFADYALNAAEVEELYLSTTLYGSAASSIQPLSAALAGTHEQSGAIASSIQPLTASASGTHEQTGTIAASLPPLSSALAGEQTQSGAIAASIQPLTSALAGTQTQSGAIASSTQPLTASASGVMQPSGAVASSIQPLTMAGVGFVQPTGTIAATLQPLSAALTGGTPLFLAFHQLGRGSASAAKLRGGSARFDTLRGG